MLIQLVDGKQESALFADGGGGRLTLGRIFFSVLRKPKSSNPAGHVTSVGLPPDFNFAYAFLFLVLAILICQWHATHTQVMCVVHFFLFGGCVRPSNFQGYKSHKEQVSDVEKRQKKTCNPLAGSRTESPLVALYIERG